MLSATVRTLLAVGGLVVFGTGLMVLVLGEVGPGLWTMIIGGALATAGIYERRRYRSAEAELASDATGPGGGEPPGERIDPRFRPTDEVFVDPTTGHKMRVLVDPRTGERRYRAEA